jgi:hypothetical protein
MKVFFVVMIFSVLTACASNQPKIYQPTKACQNYHAMMTAPMEPMAMKRLKQACDDSEKHR